MKRKFYWDRSAREGRGDWTEARPRVLASAGPMVISDHLDGTWNPADGRRYDSKSAYYKAVRAAGCEIVGNERLPERREYVPRGVGQDIKQAFEQHGF